MMRSALLLLLSLHLFPLAGFSQSVTWSFQSERTTGDEVILTATARLARGWHLYSQFLKKGGPQPTEFLFERRPDYLLVGMPLETGKPVNYYDDIYEMDITWYEGTVSFSQKIRLYPPEADIKGRIEFMTCNEQICIPGKQDMIIHVNPPKKTP